MHVFSELYHITINSINSNITFDVYHESKDTTWIDGKGYLAYILVSYVTYLQKLWTIESTTFIVSRLMASYHLLSSKSFGLQATQRLCTITSQLLRTCMVQTLLFGPINQSLLHPCVLGTQCTLVVEAGWSLEGTGSSHLWECIMLSFTRVYSLWWSYQACASLQVLLIMKPASKWFIYRITKRLKCSKVRSLSATFSQTKGTPKKAVGRATHSLSSGWLWCRGSN